MTKCLLSEQILNINNAYNLAVLGVLLNGNQDNISELIIIVIFGSDIFFLHLYILL